VQNNRIFWNGNGAAQTSYKELVETFKENNIDVSTVDKVKSTLFETTRKKVSAITDPSQITTAEKDLLAISRFDDVAKLTGEPKKQFERSRKIFQDIRQNTKTDLTKGTAQKYDRYETVGGIVLRAKDDGSVFVVPAHLENLASVGGINKTKNVVHIANTQSAETAKEVYKTLVNAEQGLDKDGAEFNTAIVVNGEPVKVILPLDDQLKNDLNFLEDTTHSLKQRKEINAQKKQERKALQSGKTPNSIDKTICERVEKAIETVPANSMDYFEQLQKAGVRAARTQNGAVIYFYLYEGQRLDINVSTDKQTKLDKVAKYMISGVMPGEYEQYANMADKLPSEIGKNVYVASKIVLGQGNFLKKRNALLLILKGTSNNS
jgi:hypothetical protein